MFTVMLENYGLYEAEILQCYGMCKMAVSIEPTDYKKYSTLLFPEFLELIGRIADKKF